MIEIPFLEAIPWKTITVMAITLGLMVAIAEVIVRYVQSRQKLQVARASLALLGRMNATMAEMCSATWDMHETMLSNTKDALIPSKKRDES